MYPEADYVMISALQHYVFCKRQCALIHIEQVWKENFLTMSGRLLHEKVHSGKREKRKSKRTSFGMAVGSAELGLSGMTDTVEHLNDGTIRIVEMKRGRPKSRDMDEVQLCAQALCLEEMLGKRIEEGDIFYGKNRRRKCVRFNDELRDRVKKLSAELHDFIDAGVTPPPESTNNCKACSLADLCMPDGFGARKSAAQYVKRMTRFVETEGSS